MRSRDDRFWILRLGTRLCSQRGGTSRHRGEHKYVQTASHLRSRSLPDDDTAETGSLLDLAGVVAFGDQILVNALESAIEAVISAGHAIRTTQTAKRGLDWLLRVPTSGVGVHPLVAKCCRQM